MISDQSSVISVPPRLDSVHVLIRECLAPVDTSSDAVLKHHFTPGLYIRTLTMPAGALILSRTHKTEHPYVVTQGKVSVWIAGTGWVTITAPHFGITKPGTQRILFIHEDCVWTTFHATPLTTPEAIVAEITEPVAIDPEIEAEVLAALRGQITQGETP